MPSPYDALRTELDAAQKARDELMKWKVIAVTLIGAAALGFSGAGPSSGAYLALVVIPFACAYVDLLCRNLSLRSKRVSWFLGMQADNDPIVQFERFYSQTKGRSALESIALVGSSLVFSIAIIPVGYASSGQGTWHRSLFLGVGGLGILMALAVEILYRLNKHKSEIGLER